MDGRWLVSPLGVLLWVAVNLGCLLLGLLHVPLAAAYPSSATTLLPELLLAGQIGFAALLAPLIARSAATTAVAAAAAWPALLLAGGLAARTTTAITASALVVTAWLLTIYFWTMCLRSSTSRQVVSAVAVALSVGPAVLEYLVIEFGPAAETYRFIASAAPVRLAFDYVSGDETGWASALPLMLLMLLGAAIWASRRCYRENAR